MCNQTVGLRSALLGSILNVKSCIYFPIQRPWGPVGVGWGGIIVLVCSVNVCQMDSAFAAVECAGNSPAQGKGKRKEKHFDSPFQFQFHG